MIATIGQKAISFITFYVIARMVGPEVTGKYFYAVSVTSVFVIFADLGLTPVVIRELAANEERGRAYLARALQCKILLLPLAVIGSLAYAWLVHAEPDVFAAVMVACAVLMADAVSLTLYGALRGKRDLRFEAMGMLIGQMLTAIIALFVLRLHVGVFALVIALLCGSVWNVGWSWRNVARRRVTPEGGAQISLITLAKAALPFGMAGFFVKVYSYADSLLIRQYFGHVAVGQYAVAYKVTYALQFLPLVFVAALYPAMSADFAAGKYKELRGSFKNALRVMMIASVPLSALLSALAQPIIMNFYGKLYAGAIAPMVVLPWVLIPIFLDFPVGSLLNATHRSMLKTTSMGMTMVVNVVLNLVLVPKFGPLGAAYAGVISFWMLFFLGFWFARHDLPSRGWVASFFVRGMASAGVIWIATRFIASGFPFMAQALFGTAVSVMVLFLFRLCTVNDLMAISAFLRRRAQPAPDASEDTLTT